MTSKEWLSRLFKIVRAGGLAFLGLEFLGLVGSVTLQFFYYPSDSSGLRPGIRTLVHRVGFLYQSQQRKMLFTYDPLLGYRWLPGANLRNLDQLHGGAATEIWVNPDGLLPNQAGNWNPPGAKRDREKILIFTGGSTVAGQGVMHPVETLPSQLEQELNRRCRVVNSSAPFVRVINAGVYGYNSIQEYLFFLSSLLHLRPDAWIQMNGINETWNFGKHSGSSELYFNKSLFGLQKADPVVAFSFLPAFQKLVFHWAPAALWNRGVNERVLFSHPVHAWSISSLTARYLETIYAGKDLARRHGIEHYYFLQPTSAIGRGKLNKEEDLVRKILIANVQWAAYTEDAQAFYDQVRSDAPMDSKKGWSDLSSLFFGVPEKVYYDPRHYNERGNALLAQRIANEILGNGSAICR